MFRSLFLFIYFILLLYLFIFNYYSLVTRVCLFEVKDTLVVCRGPLVGTGPLVYVLCGCVVIVSCVCMCVSVV